MGFSLVDAVGPDLYRRNAFLALGLPADASEGDIRRRIEEVRLTAADEDAVGRLEDPLSRLVERAFSRWPDSPRTARHNAAVEAHARALDHQVSDPAGVRLWQAAFQAWRAALPAEDGFWELLVEGADSETVETVRAGLPAALLSINARLAVRACHEGRSRDATWQFTLVRESGFDQPTVETALRAAVDADVVRLRALGERAVLSASADPDHAHETAARLLDQTATPLAVLTAALPGDHPLLLGLRDETALQALRCTVLFANRTSDWDTALDLSTRILPIAASDQATGVVRANQEAVRSKLLHATCWFCERRPAVDGAAHRQRLYGEIDQRVHGKVSWRTVTVDVPRCAKCERAHALRPLRAGCTGFAVIAAVLTCTAVAVPDQIPAACCVAFLLALVTLRVARQGPPRSRITKFAPVGAYLDKGWKLGTKPPGAR